MNSLILHFGSNNDKKIDKKGNSFLVISMKLIKSMNPNIYYCFGNKDDSLMLVKSEKVAVNLAGEKISLDKLVMADQTHSAEIKVIDESDLGCGFVKNKPAIPVVDGFVTDMTSVYIVIKGADCTPVLILAKTRNAVGGCHSGREGTKKGIVKELISKMVTEYHLKVDDLVIMIGPAISGNNYQVSEEIFTDFVNSTGLEQDYRKIDMQKVIVRDALTMGINEDNVILNNECTFANPKFFSYRRDKTKNRQLSIIGIADGKIFE